MVHQSNLLEHEIASDEYKSTQKLSIMSTEVLTVQCGGDGVNHSGDLTFMKLIFKSLDSNYKI